MKKCIAFVLFLATLVSFGQYIISGKVTDERGGPILGVDVRYFGNNI